MPGERRNPRANNKESSPSTNGEKAPSDSQSSSSNKDKPVPTRTSSKGTGFHSKEVSINSAVKDAAEDKPHTNGAEPVENGVNGSKDVDMSDDGHDHGKPSVNRDGDDMLVVVPTPKGSRPSGEPVPNLMEDVPMENTETNESEIAETEKIDTKVKALTGELKSTWVISTKSSLDCGSFRGADSFTADIKANFTLLERAVAQFDARFTLRVLRSMSSVRKFLSPDLLAQIITETYTSSSAVAKSLLAAIDREDTSFEAPDTGSEMDIDMQGRDKSYPTSKPNGQSKEVIPEVDLYLSILVQIHLYDTRAIELGAKFSSNVVGRLRTLNRRTLDSLAARVYFYYSLFFEQLAPLPPSPLASVVSIRQNLLTALRTSVLRKDQDTRATVTTLLLRNYLSTAHISQADLLISHSEFPPTASSNQIARYLYYLGRIRAIQLSYTEAHEHLIGATRKSPATPSAGGFYQASTKLLIIVELLMGDIPDRAIFRQPSLERAMQPYLNLVQAVRVGKIDGFLNVVQTHNAIFRRDGTYTLILRLRQNVIKTGIRMMSLSYARISLRDICFKLDLESEESAEYIVAKAIRDGVIEATLDHERGFMKSKEVGDIYATREPGEAFHERIRACLDLHDESVKVCESEQLVIDILNANALL